MPDSLSAFDTVAQKYTHLIVNVRDVHDEVHVVPKVVRHDSPQDVLSHIVPDHDLQQATPAERQHSPSMPHMRRVVHRRPAVVPLYMVSIIRDEFCLWFQ